MDFKLEHPTDVKYYIVEIKFENDEGDFCAETNICFDSKESLIEALNFLESIKDKDVKTVDDLNNLSKSNKSAEKIIDDWYVDNWSGYYIGQLSEVRILWCNSVGAKGLVRVNEKDFF